MVPAVDNEISHVHCDLACMRHERDSTLEALQRYGMHAGETELASSAVSAVLWPNTSTASLNVYWLYCSSSMN